ncbi:MAG: HTH-type transcriptional regulator SinR [Pelotomaculum sp. PtaB.Bin013]|uniref:Helix-turn-helix transcriptional regulator n=1 Tax=Pelotomaculum isophthalicicum JI TaxID=947010 RepID=A0A9X4GZ16_9FIRM|nr:helix-turn-helix transcriptional regulator [Pelotomaculum isophthalicicum]MDF9408285.1 helix-turn-helix transcriptional regulator [Pelotomaculum isophthalicicum JI]OPX82833.1 MAG: HTH-type transcriptional regulator SinR [Pelotomaculum sp. PtaB.Bin013]
MFDILKVCGQNIRRYRKEKDLTLEQLSHSLGITGSYLGYLERGQRNTSLLTLAKIAKILGVPPDILLRVPKDEFEKALYELHDLLINLNDVKHVTFLKEVMESYLKLKDT